MITITNWSLHYPTSHPVLLKALPALGQAAFVYRAPTVCQALYLHIAQNLSAPQISLHHHSGNLLVFP